MFTRREFVKTSSLVALAPTVPAFLRRTAEAAAPQPDERILVVIQLDGGNDGLNTVVPFADEGYSKYRETLRLPEERLLKLDDSFALHPSMGDAAKMFEEQRLAIVQGVGYPNPSRSHDVSMAIWESARLDPEEHNNYGWIGRALDLAPTPRGNAPSSALVDNGPIPLALRGRKAVASSFDSVEEMLSFNNTARAIAGEASGPAGLETFLRRQTLDAYATAELLQDLARSDSRSGASYPSTRLADRLKLIAQLIKANLGTRVYYAVQSGYDTHSVQLPIHSRLLRELAGGMKAFLDDLKAAKLDDRVLIVCFSEFGRQVKENASAGTDHGTAGPVLVAGPSVVGGIHGEPLDLLELENNAPHFTTDFRSVYATLTEGWLGISSATDFNQTFDRLSLFQLP